MSDFSSIFETMKKFKLIASILTVISLLLCGWTIYEMNSEGGNLVASSLNLIYFTTLFIVFLCMRITAGYSGKIEPVNSILSAVIIGLSTYTWVNSVELLLVGKYTLALLPILIGTTLMQVVKSDSKFSKILQMGIGVISLSMTVCVFTGAMGTWTYTTIFIGLTATTLAALGFALFAKTT